ncbi:MAG: hypothetical protein HOC82_20930 [Bacteroidetes bacterium]|nr:hypothetical protein [Bacteroidota bacterium]
MNILSHSLSVLAIVFALSGCNSNADNHEFFPGEYPGIPEISINNDEIEISNNAILAKWQLVNNSIILSEITNKYDNEFVHLQGITLFTIELHGKQLTNLDFKLQGELCLESIAVTDSLPTKALRFPGKKVSGLFFNENQQISIKWTAQLREGSNYIRQNIEIQTIDKPAILTKVGFFDGELSGASYAGLVLGSPITYNNFFFGMEHPIVQSEALMARSIGNASQSLLDVTNIIDRTGEYLISIELAASTGFNINSMALAVNDEIISEDKHPFQGSGGSAQYHLDLSTYDSLCKYEILTDLVNPQRAAGNLTIYRKTNDLLNFFIERTDELIPGKSISEWSVIGVTPKDQNRRAFLYYLERERARPYKQFLHYNCWWDITDDGASSFTSEQLIERMHAWNEKFIEPYDVQLNSFVFDDGWDNLDSVWYFDPDKFPNGFTPQAELCEKYNSGIGVWMSPFGGYLENKQRRVKSAKREGLETNSKGLSLAGSNYYQRFYERASDMLINYGVNYFKFDGFGGSEPAYLPDMEAGARLIKNLRKQNPEVFINITVGSWPSPFWLQYADCTWRGSG